MCLWWTSRDQGRGGNANDSGKFTQREHQGGFNLGSNGHSLQD